MLKSASRIARLLGVLAAAALVIFFVVQPGRELVEVERMRAAVVAAESWHLEGESMTTDGARWRVVKSVVCPNDAWVSETRIDASGTAHVSEVAVVRGRYYSRASDGRWLVGEAPAERQPDCMGSGPLFPEIGSLFGSLGDVSRNGSVSKGELVSDGGVQCRVWRVRFPDDPDDLRGFEICADEGDPLPRSVTFGGNRGSYRFSQWNAVALSAPN